MTSADESRASAPSLPEEAGRRSTGAGQMASGPDPAVRAPAVPARLLFRERIYAGALALARPVLPLAGRVSGKIGQGVAGRQGTIGRLWAWARESRDPARPLIWLHAPSVGEGLMAQAIMSVLRARAPPLQLAFT